MPKTPARYLTRLISISAAINVLLNAPLGWFLHRQHETIELWGKASIAVDAMVTAIVVSVLVGLVVTPITRGDLSAGRVTAWPAQTKVARFSCRFPADPLPLGGLAIILVPLALWFVSAIGIESLSLWRFVTFKAIFAALLAALITLIAAGRALNSNSLIRADADR